MVTKLSFPSAARKIVIAGVILVKLELASQPTKQRI